MAFTHGRGTVILVNERDMSMYFNNLDATSEVDVPECTTFGESARRYRVVGLQSGSISLSGFFDGATDAVDQILSTSLGSSSGLVVTAAMDTTVVGKPLKLALSRTTSYRATSPVDGVVSVSADILADDMLTHGVSLHALVSESATGTGAAHDNGAATSTGGVGHLHVTANSRNNTTTIVVQHSVDASVWTDLLTFTTVGTTITYERKTVTGTVNRYLRATWTFAATPTGALTFLVGFARR